MILPPAFAEEKNTVHAVIETPRGSRNKYNYDEQHDFFKLKRVLPAGTFFPFDFGFIPHTKGEDGDPLDVMVISDYPSHTGCVIECRVIGVFEVVQKEKRQKPVRNDRIFAVPRVSLNYSEIKKIEDLSDNLIKEVSHFFEYYTTMAGKEFRLIRTAGAVAAIRLIKNHLED